MLALLKVSTTSLAFERACLSRDDPPSIGSSIRCSAIIVRCDHCHASQRQLWCHLKAKSKSFCQRQLCGVSIDRSLSQALIDCVNGIGGNGNGTTLPSCFLAFLEENYQILFPLALLQESYCNCDRRAIASLPSEKID
ncbi:hypothetical protein TYRP_015535 [Tyrophagus putrescentiae]|nr:hypothetical protein TYRP_015535 [Tyrophagus putrescentiae]